MTFSLTLPSFFVLNTLLGVRAEFGLVLRAQMMSQAALTFVLASLVTYTLLWYLSFEGYPKATLINRLMFALASLAGQLFLRRAYVPLLARKPVHRWLLRSWLVLYTFSLFRWPGSCVLSLAIPARLFSSSGKRPGIMPMSSCTHTA